MNEKGRVTVKAKNLCQVAIIAAAAAALAGCPSDPAFHEAAVSDAGVSMIEDGSRGNKDASGFAKITIRNRRAVFERYANKAEGRASQGVSKEGTPQITIVIEKSNNEGEIPVGTTIVCTDVPASALTCTSPTPTNTVVAGGFRWDANE